MKNIVQECELDFENLKRIVCELKNTYPFIDCYIIGRSLCGRPIYALSIGRSKSPVVISAGYHGTEWLASLTLLKFIETLCNAFCSGESVSGIDVSGALQNREVIFIPVVNPDGVEIAINGYESAGMYENAVKKISGGHTTYWNANAHGVDINHNFDAGWNTLRGMEEAEGISGPSPRRYGGVSPESEPETAAVTRLCRLRNPRQAAALHSQGEEIFWRYGEAVPEKSERMAKILSAASGYELIDNSGLASHGGFKDWFIKELNRPAFTFELGKGENPLPVSELENIYYKIEQMLTLFSIM